MAYNTLKQIFDLIDNALSSILPFPLIEEQELNTRHVHGIKRFEVDEIVPVTLGTGGYDRASGRFRIFIVYGDDTTASDVVDWYDIVRTQYPPGSKIDEITINAIQLSAASVSGANRVDEILVQWDATITR